MAVRADDITKRRTHQKTAAKVTGTEKESPGMFPALLTVGEVAHKLRVDDSTVRRWVKQGILEAVTLPHREGRQGYRIRQATMDALLGGYLIRPDEQN